MNRVGTAAAGSTPAGASRVSIRSERPADAAAIRALVDAAFATQDEESGIIDRLRASDRWIPELSLVAVAVDGTIVGHCVTSAGDLVADGGTVRPILTLGPICVAPSRQREGIGAMLVRRTIDLASAAGWPAIVLLGHAAYYPRFGFEPARELGILAPAAWPDEAWMALRLPAWTPDVVGTVRYPAAFGIA